MTEPTFDKDGYPTDETLKTITDWDVCDPVGLFEFLKAAWNSTGTIREPEDNVFEFVTGGWSGNESLIGAYQKNSILWVLCWEMSQRGGLFRFEIPENFRRDGR